MELVKVLIASKIAATLSSVGTPSFNLSANDLFRGDLGSISKKYFNNSYSGQTEELRNIITSKQKADYWYCVEKDLFVQGI